MQKLFIIGLYVLISINNTCFSQPPSSPQDPVDPQSSVNKIDSFFIHGDVKVTIDRPFHRTLRGKLKKKLIVAFFALPNGNSTEQTMGKKMEAGDDWHFDIQHIRAQTLFIRSELKNTSFVVIYLENKYKSWPAWKQKHPDFSTLIPQLVDSLSDMVSPGKKEIYLNGHSGGGSFIFGYLAGVPKVPGKIKRISFLDSNYGYDSSYFPKLKTWLTSNKGAALNVFAYNDSVALYNGRPVVSATGGTWYRGHLMLAHLQSAFSFDKTAMDSLSIYKSRDKRIQFFFKHNYNRGIYHTQQVELNGFIHSVLAGTRYDSRNYTYYGRREYGEFIE